MADQSTSLHPESNEPHHNTSGFETTIRELADIKRALAESTIVAFTDHRGKINYVNDKFCEISKYSRSELIGQDHRIINSGHHPKKFFRDLWETISTGKVWRGEICNRAKDGSLYWVASTIIPFIGANGKPVRFAAIRHDITEQKRIEKSLRESENLLREQKELLEHAHDAIYSWNVGGGINYWNKSSERLYGYTEREVSGRDINEILDPDYTIPREEYEQRLKRDSFWEGEITQTAKNGRRIIVESRQFVTTLDDGSQVVLEANRDITDRKEARERIRQQASLLEKTRDAILVCDLNHRIIFWNQGAENLYGFSSEQVLGEELSHTICRGDRSVTEKALNALKTSDEWREEATNFTKDGNEIRVISRWTLVRNERGNPDYYLIVNTDISDLKNAEQQLLRSQRLESIGTLAGGIAHDLNNVLSPILMVVDMLDTDLDLPQSSKPWLSIIRENTIRGADLIKQVLTFARGAGEGNRIPLQPGHLIKEILKVLQQTLPQGIGIEFKIDPNLWLITADPTQVHQVLMNLAVNAKDAMPSGGILKVTARNALIDMEFKKSNPEASVGKYVLINVEDSGTGMSGDIVDRIWDPFFTTKDVGKGTGLGLPTALSIVKGHGGFISVSSKPDEGTKFAVYFPVSEVDSDVEESDQPTVLAAGNGEMILIVDDEEDIRRITSATLEKYGYQTLTAANGAEAIAIFTEREKIDLVLTDMAMPKMDGAAAIRVLRKINPEQKIVAVSGLADSNESRTESMSANAFLAKPFTTEKLLDVVARIFGNQA